MKILLNAAVAAITILPVTLHAEETKCPPQPERSCLYEDRIYTEGAKLKVDANLVITCQCQNVPVTCRWR